MADSARVTPPYPQAAFRSHDLTLPFYNNIQGQQMHQLVKTLVAKLDDLSSVFMYHMERKN